MPASEPASGIKVAVVTPYHLEPEAIIRQCHRSVMEQTYPCTHVLVADGHAQPALESLDALHVALPRESADCGNTPRAVGSLLAMGQGFDAITFLDADNWFAPGHVEGLLRLHVRTGAWVCSSARNLVRGDGSLLMRCPEVDGETFVDTNCFLFTRDAFDLAALWGLMPKEMAPVCDRFVWRAALQRKYPRAHLPEATVFYRTRWKAHYDIAGEPAPEGAKGSSITKESEAWFRAQPPQVVGRILRLIEGTGGPTPR